MKEDPDNRDEEFLEETNQGPRPLEVMGGQGGAAALELYLSEDEMSIWANFYPPLAGGKLLVADQIQEAVLALGDVQNFDHRRLQESVFKCNMEKQTLKGVVLAQGKAPVKEVPGYLKLTGDLFQRSLMQEQHKIRVDYKEYSPIVVVKKGQILAHPIPPRKGLEGVTVLGKSIPFGKKDVTHLIPGENTVLYQGAVVARVSGQFVREGNNFSVKTSLEIPGNVDYSTGHINFPGDVIIGGSVLEGFRVACGGNLTIKGVLDVSEVLVRGFLKVGGGIIGHEPGILRVGKGISAVFVEHTLVECLGDMKISKNIIQSRCFIKGNLEMDDAGKIIASLVQCRGSLVTGQLGSDASHVRVVMGSDFVVLRRVEHLKLIYRELDQDILKIESQPLKNRSEKMNTLLERLLERRESLMEEINSLQEKVLNTESEVVLIAKSSVYPGVELEMGSSHLAINAASGAMIYRMTEDGKAILSEKYNRDQKESTKGEEE